MRPCGGDYQPASRPVTRGGSRPCLTAYSTSPRRRPTSASRGHRPPSVRRYCGGSGVSFSSARPTAAWSSPAASTKTLLAMRRAHAAEISQSHSRFSLQSKEPEQAHRRTDRRRDPVFARLRRGYRSASASVGDWGFHRAAVVLHVAASAPGRAEEGTGAVVTAYQPDSHGVPVSPARTACRTRARRLPASRQCRAASGR